MRREGHHERLAPLPGATEVAARVGGRYLPGMRSFLERLRPWAPLMLRLTIATILVYYGFLKIARGMGDFVKYVTDMHLPRWVAFATAWTEAVGGILIGLGFLTRFVAFACMLALVVVEFRGKLKLGFSGGMDLPVLCAAVLLSLVLSGAGRGSVDHRLFGNRFGG